MNCTGFPKITGIILVKDSTELANLAEKCDNMGLCYNEREIAFKKAVDRMYSNPEEAIFVKDMKELDKIFKE